MHRQLRLSQRNLIATVCLAMVICAGCVPAKRDNSKPAPDAGPADVGDEEDGLAADGADSADGQTAIDAAADDAESASDGASGQAPGGCAANSDCLYLEALVP